MSALTSLLARDGVVPVRAIEEALQRQVMSGGDVETVFLEMDSLPENVLAAYRAALFELPPAGRDEIMAAADEVRSLVPADVAVEHRLIPLRVVDRVLEVAVHKPLEPARADRLGFLLGYELRAYVACEVRIAAALAVHYGVELAPRMRRLVGKLESRDAGALPDVSKGGVGLGGHALDLPHKGPHELDAPPSQPAAVLLSSPLELEPDADALDVSPRPLASAQEVKPSHGALHTFKRVRGPMTLSAGERLLRRATSRDQIIEVLFGFATQFFDYTALFVVGDDAADGWAAHGPGASSDAVVALSFALDEASVFSEARRTRSPHVGPLERTPIDRELAKRLDRPASVPAMVMPVAIRQRVVLILYGDRAGEAFDLGGAMELIRFGPRVVEAFEQLIIRKKRVGYAASSSAPAAGDPARADLKTTARSVARTAGSERPRRPARDSGEWRPGRRRTSPGFSPPQSVKDNSWQTVERAPSALRVPEPPAAQPEAPPPDRSTPDRSTPDRSTPDRSTPDRSTQEASSAPAAKAGPPPPARREAASILGIPRAAPLPPSASAEIDLSMSGDDEDDEPEISFGEPEDDDTEITIEVDGDDDEPGDDDDEPEISFDAGDDDDALSDEEEYLLLQELEREVDAAQEAAARPKKPSGGYILRDASVEVFRPRSERPKSAPPTERPERASDRPPEVVRVPDSIRPTPRSEPPRGLDAETRSVIVDMGEQVHAQVEDLCASDDEEEWRSLGLGLLALGEAALPVLAQAFPGLLRWERNSRRPMPRGRELSGIASALVRFGDRAVPYVSALLSSAHPDVRFYSSLVAAELVHEDLMDAVAERIHDEDDGVRHIALQLLPRFAEMRGFDEIRTVVRRTARIRGRDLTRRHDAVDALGALRDAAMIPKLIELLREDDADLLEHVLGALRLLTACTFSRGPRKWESWWERNRSRHRVEWMIDGLSHAEEDTRRLAHDELKSLTQEYFGYHPGSPKRDRELIAHKYRDWWESEGRSRLES